MSKVFRSIEHALGYWTECELATLEGMYCVKRTAKYEIQRHESIVSGMIASCRAYGVQPHNDHTRLNEYLGNDKPYECKWNKKLIAK